MRRRAFDEKNVRVLPDPDAVADTAAQIVVEAVEKGGDRNFSLVLSGGVAPRRLYERLAISTNSSRIDWKRLHCFWGDERCVPPDHPDSNFRMAKEALLDKVSIPQANIHRLPGEAPDLALTARTYEKEIRELLKGAVFDLVLLGMGGDGHTASLFPGTTALHEIVRWVVPNNVPQLGAYRLTMTPLCINQAKTILFLVTGKEKAERLKEVLEGPYEPDRLPIQLICAKEGRRLWLLDEAAASGLGVTGSGLRRT